MSLKIIVTLYYTVCVCGSTLLSLLLILNGILISITCGTVGSVNVSFFTSPPEAMCQSVKLFIL